MDYISENKKIIGGKQMIWRNHSGEKFRTFSFSTLKHKITTQGSHDCLAWVNLFGTLRSEVEKGKDITSPILGILTRPRVLQFRSK